jgi:5,5'-dehydrodivanillate O-demethylase oxygenase subunit
MPTHEENELMTRIGPGTPCGELLRRYWQPVCAVGELTEEQPKKRVRILGEDLVVFRALPPPLSLPPGGRGSMGYGLLAEQCSHRGASLYYGFVEGDCLRCPYHGWLYDRDGRYAEQPFEPAQSMMRHTLRHPSYPVEELGGLLFTYMGPPDRQPLLPAWDILTRRDGTRRLEIRPVLECNWLQPMENSVDGTHIYFLHENYAVLAQASGTGQSVRTRPLERYGFRPFEWGLLKSWYYGDERRTRYLGRPSIFPNMQRITFNHHWRVPIDDTHTRIFVLTFTPTPDGREAENADDAPFRYARSWKNEEGEYTMADVQSQDGMAWETQGPLYDRTTENLGATDRGIAIFRELLLDQIARVQRGEDPSIGLLWEQAVVDLRPWMNEGGGAPEPPAWTFDAQHETFEVPIGAARPRSVPGAR